MTYQHPHDVDDTSRSLEDLCAPVSARKMPLKSLLGRSVHMDENQARALQRNAASNGNSERTGGWRQLNLRVGK